MNSFRRSSGFSLIEILVVIFIVTTLVALPVGFFWGFGRTDALVATTREVVGVLHEAQTNTISGKSVDGQNPSSYGLYFATNYYVLFSGTSYNANDSNNARTDLPQGMIFSQINVPSSIIVFDKITGKVRNYSDSAHSVQVQDSNTQEQKTITISELGAIHED